MEVHIIHDSRRFERYESFMKQFQEHGIMDYMVWDATVLIHSVVESINESHKKIVRYAKEKELPMVCIMEDDIQFTAPDAWQYFLNNMPESFDLYLGCNYSIPIGQTKNVTGFHLYVISQGFYDRFLSVPNNVHIDTAMDELEGDYHFCYPYPALQSAGFSANNSAYSNYNSVLKPKDIYGRK